MYSVSESYRAKMLDKVQTHRLTGTIDGVNFTEADVIGVSYKNQCTQKNVLIGSVNIGVLKFTLLRDLLNRGDYHQKKVVINDGLLLGYDENDEPIWEDIPIGEFYISEALWTAAGIDITAYDVLSKLDKPVQISQTSSKLYGFCQYIATETGTTFGMTELECDALPNGTEIIGIYEEANFETFRDLLSALAQMAGGFAYADRNGTWKIRAFDDDPILTIPKNRRKTGSSFSDFETLYDTIKFTDAQEKIVRVVGDGNGLEMNLGTQPFLQLGVYEAKMRRAQNIVNSIKRMKYTPFSSSMLPAFAALDLGDVISMPDDFSEDTSTGAVMAATWTYNNSFTVNCFGDNPSLRNSQSKADKNIAGLINNTTQNEVTYYTFANLDPINIEPDTETTIASMAFTSAQTTTVKIMHEFIFDMLRNLGVNGSYEIRYYLDNELVSYKPYESLSAIMAKTEVPIVPQPQEEPYTEEKEAVIEPVDYSITKDFFYILRNVAPNQRHTWQVKILTHGIEETVIDTNHAHVVLEGQRLYGEGHFDGNVEVAEDFYIIPIGGMGLISMSDEAPVIDVRNVLFASASDNVRLYQLSGLNVNNLTEEVSILFVWEALITEDGDDFITEDGEDEITSQG